MSALTVAVKFAGSSTPSRTTVEKPVSVKLTLYVPCRRSTIVYRPLASVTADFDFSISAGLAASTVTPGSTPPDSSFTVPAIWLCAAATIGSASTHTIASRTPIQKRRRIDTTSLRKALKGTDSVQAEQPPRQKNLCENGPNFVKTRRFMEREDSCGCWASEGRFNKLGFKIIQVLRRRL